MGKHDLSLLVIMAFLMAGNKNLARALKDSRNSNLGSPKAYNPSKDNYKSIKNIKCPQNYLSGHKPLYHRKVI